MRDQDRFGEVVGFVAQSKPSITWIRNLFLLLLTFVTTTLAGVVEPFGKLRIFPELDKEPDLGLGEFFLRLPELYAQLISSALSAIINDPEALRDSLSFSLSLLLILLSHEMGHYLMCRKYGVASTLPFFIPSPPLIGPAGTLGAFIKIKSPLPSRKATFDIGVAGPIAGFIAIIPVMVIGLLSMEEIPKDVLNNGIETIYFSDPLMTQIVGFVLGIDPSDGYMNPFLAATWLGLLVTALNLIPSGQLDGGHAVYSVFGSRIHAMTGRFAFLIMIVFSVIGWILYSVPGAILFTILLGFMMRVRHPRPVDDSPLDKTRMVVALITCVIFAVSFTPFPIKIGVFN